MFRATLVFHIFMDNIWTCHQSIRCSHQRLLQSQTTRESISKPIGALQIDHVTQIQPMAGLYFTNKNDGKGAPLLKFNIPTLSNILRDGGNSGTAFEPSRVHITKRDPKPNRHRDKDNLWSEMWPCRVHITYMNPKQNRYIENEYLRVARNTRVWVIIAFAP